MHMQLYTDYPFEELGDNPGEEAPIRKIIALNFDGNKYCDIIVDGIKSNIKAGYIYIRWGRSGEVPPFNPKEYFENS